jgi:hypothetical protein
VGHAMLDLILGKKAIPTLWVKKVPRSLLYLILQFMSSVALLRQNGASFHYSVFTNTTSMILTISNTLMI